LCNSLKRIEELVREQISGGSTIDELSQYLKDPDEAVRLGAVEAFEALGDGLVADDLAALYPRETSDQMKLAIITAIGSINAPPPMELLESIIADTAISDDLLEACLLAMCNCNPEGTGRVCEIEYFHVDERYRRIAHEVGEGLMPPEMASCPPPKE